MLNNSVYQFLTRLKSSIAAGKPGSPRLSDEAFDALYTALYGDVLHNDPLIDLIKSNARRKSTIYDIGAAHGSYSVYLARKIAGVTVYAFEPFPVAFQYLTDYTAKFGLKGKIIAFNAAISDTAGKNRFYVSSDNGRCSFHEYNASGNDSKILQAIDVDCYTVDMLVRSKKCPPPDVLKIDTEGHEYEVLKGAEEVIGKFKPKIYYEPHETNRDASEKAVSSEIKVQAFLSGYGYSFKKYGYPIYCY